MISARIGVWLWQLFTIALRALAGLLLLALLLSALLAAALFTPIARPLLPVVAQWIPGLQIEHARGAVAGPLSIERLVYDDAHLRLEVKQLRWRQVQIDWHGVGVRVAGLRAGDIVWTWKGGTRSGNTSALPVSLPLALRIDGAQIGALTFRALGQSLRLQHIETNLRARRDGSAELALVSNDHALEVRAAVQAGIANAQIVLTALDTQQLGHFPAARLTGSATVRVDATQSDIEWRLTDSVWNGHVFDTSGSARQPQTGVIALQAQARIGSNTLRLQGDLGDVSAQAARFTWRIDARDLAQLGFGLRGSVSGHGTVAGELATPRLEAQVRGRGLVLNEYRIKNIEIDATPDARNTNRVQVRIGGLRSAQLAPSDAQLLLRGTPQQHRLVLTAQRAGTPVHLSIDGAWHDGTWHGSVTQLTLGGAYPVALQDRIAVVWTPSSVAVGSAHLKIGSGRLALERLERRNGVIVTSGTIESFPVALLRQWLPGAIASDPGLTLGGRWRLELGATASGEIKLWRERGDLTLLSNPPQALGLQDAELRADIKDAKLTFFAYLRGNNSGTLQVQGNTQLTLHDGYWGIARDAPTQLDATLEIADIAWLGVVSDRVRDIGGSLSAQLHARGPILQPQWSGSIRGAGLRATQPDSGVHYRDGAFSATLDGAMLRLTQAGVKSANGNVSASGELNLHTQDGSFDIQANKIDVLADADRSMVASGQGNLRIENNRIAIAGKTKIDRARIQIPKDEGPTISQDVIIVGREQDTDTDKNAGSALPAIDLDVDLGDQFFVKGHGADVQVGGHLHLRNANGSGIEGIAAIGNVNVTRGSYAAYGQRLDIDHGVLTFNGPLDNPALDIVALRKNQTVQAGVAVTGTALVPVVRLVSIPEVPDSEKLSWLVLGHGLDNSNRGEFNVLNQAASALLAQGESVSLQAKLAQYFGVDELRLSSSGTGGGLEQTIVTVGKRVSSALYLSYERGVSNTSNLLRLRYTLSPRWSVQTESGNKDNAVDLFYTISFD